MDALIRTISVPENYSDSLDIKNLAGYLRGKASNLELEDDKHISYAAEQMERLSRKIYGLKKGQEGEVLAKRAMFGIDAPNQILTNMEFSMDGLPFETDAIVINSKGICIVEVKNIHRDLVVNDIGIGGGL